MRTAYVYILAGHSGVLYTGVTSDLPTRVWEHKTKRYPDSFTAKYEVNRLVYYEEFPKPFQAIQAEKKIKGWLRAKKVALIVSKNPKWEDLSEGWFGPVVEDSTLVNRDDPNAASQAVTGRADRQSPSRSVRCAQDDPLAPTSRMNVTR